MLLLRITAAASVCCVILLSLVHLTESKGCPSLTFGNRCQFKCRCNGDECNSTSGDCTNGSSCTKGFFGRACQYVNVVTTSDKSPAWLTDDNPNTCNNKTSSQKGPVFVALLNKIMLSFIRIHLKPGYVSKNTVILLIDAEGPCVHSRQYMISTQVMELTCHTEALMSSFRIDGDVVPSLCGVEVSSGRPLSYKKTMYYSSANKTAVSCERTKLAEDLVITYIADAPQFIFTITVAVMLDVLKSFTVYFDQDHYTINEADYNSSLERFDYSLYSQMAVRNLTFSHFDGTGDIDFCDIDTVVVMGDSMCGSKKHGFTCEMNCACQLNQLCQMDGKCMPGCDPGWYGRLCFLMCGLGCVSKSCQYTTGVCNCSEGYVADGTCDTQCPEGTYGRGCAKSCSAQCNGQCDIMTGHCKTCDIRLFGPFCQYKCNAGCESGLCNKESGHCLMCPDTKFGYSCDHDCPQGCLNGICNVTTGSCFTCKIGFYGVTPCVNGTLTKTSDIPDDFALDFANPCDETFVHCYVACSSGCENKYCEKQSGTCTCLSQYRGPTCDEHSSERPELIWMVLFSIPFISLCAILFFCFPKKQKPVGETRISVAKSSATINSIGLSQVSSTVSTSL